jgi:predicted lipoprotein with Yx(FWY)xxD motif
MRATPTIATGLAALAASAAVAIAATHPTVKAVNNATIGKKIVVDAKKGMTLYYLTGDAKASKCSTATCTSFWPPLTVKSLHTKVVKGKGIVGKLTVFKRPDGKFQVALRGKPLYHFALDSAKGQTKGEGIVSFGGTWHAMPAAGY